MIMSSTSPTIIRTMSDINNLQKNKSILIAGFPGPGLVGSISTSYIIDKLNMHQIACVESEYISPGVIYVDGKLRHPFRLYANKEGNVCVLVCEAPIIINDIHSVLNTVMDWAIKNTIQEVLVLDGIPVQGIPRPDRQPIILGSTEMDENIVNSINNKDNKNEKGKKFLPTIKFITEYLKKNNTEINHQNEEGYSILMILCYNLKLIENFEEKIKLNDERKYVIPTAFEMFMRSVSISTTRGIVYAELRGTYLHNAIMPVFLIDKMEPIELNEEQRKVFGQ